MPESLQTLSEKWPKNQPQNDFKVEVISTPHFLTEISTPRENRPTFKATKALSGTLTLFWSARPRELRIFANLSYAGPEPTTRFRRLGLSQK